MRLKDTFETMELEEWIVAVPVGESFDNNRCVIKLNRTAADIFKLLSNDISEREIVDDLYNRYDVSKEQLLEDVHKYIVDFNEKGLLAQ